MPKLIAMDDDPDSEGGILFTLSAEEGEDASELASIVGEQGVPWEFVEPADVGLAIRLQMYLQSDNPSHSSVRIVTETCGGGDYGQEGGSVPVGGNSRGLAVDDYFKAYEDMGVHELMLRDRPRMEAYRGAMHANRWGILFCA